MGDSDEVNRILRAKSSFEVLKVTPRTSRDDLKKAYKKAALATHPDKNNNPEGAEAFSKVKKAYEDVEKCKDFAENPFINLEDQFSADQSGIYANFLAMLQELSSGQFTHLLNIVELLSARENLDINMDDIKQFLTIGSFVVNYCATFIQLCGNDIMQLNNCIRLFSRVKGFEIRLRFHYIFLFMSLLLLLPVHLIQHFFPVVIGHPVAAFLLFFNRQLLMLSNKF